MTQHTSTELIGPQSRLSWDCQVVCLAKIILTGAVFAEEKFPEVYVQIRETRGILPGQKDIQLAILFIPEQETVVRDYYDIMYGSRSAEQIWDCRQLALNPSQQRVLLKALKVWAQPILDHYGPYNIVEGKFLEVCA